MTREQFDAITEAFAKLNNVDIDTAGYLVAEIGDVHILAENGRVIAAGKTWLWPDDENTPGEGMDNSARMEQVRRESPELGAGLSGITPERWNEKFTTQEGDWELVPQNRKTITAIFTGPDAAHIATATASFATLPGSAHVEWTIPPGAPELKTQPATAYAETFESEMRALAAASGATVGIAERGEWAELAE